MSAPQAAGEGTSTKDSAASSAVPIADENELISPRRMKYALKKENSTAESYVSMIRSKSDRNMQANSISNSAPAKVVRQSSSEALVQGGDKKSPRDPEGEVRPRAQTVGTVAVNSTVKQESPRADPEPPKTARGDLEKRDRKEKEKDKEKEKHKRSHTKKSSTLNLNLEAVKTPTTTTTATSTSKHESTKRDKKDKKDKKDKHTKRSETIASPRHQPAQVTVTEEPKVRFGEPQVKFTEPAPVAAAPVVAEVKKTESAPQLLNTAIVSGPVVDLFVDHLIAQKGPLKKSIDQLIQTLLQEHEHATSKQLSEMRARIEELTNENTKLKEELDALKKK